MLKIRLSRQGRKKRAFFRIIVSDSRFDTQGRFLENLGHFDPKNKTKTLSLKKERILHWLSQGAQASATVHNILVDQKVAAGPKIKATTGKKKKEAEKKPAEKTAASLADKITADQPIIKPPADKLAEQPAEIKKEEVKKEEVEPPAEEVKPKEKTADLPAEPVAVEKLEKSAKTNKAEPDDQAVKMAKIKELITEKARVEKILARHAKTDPKIDNNYIANFQTDQNDKNEEEKEVFEFEEAELNSDLVQKLELRLKEINQSLTELNI